MRTVCIWWASTGREYSTEGRGGQAAPRPAGLRPPGDGAPGPSRRPAAPCAGALRPGLRGAAGTWTARAIRPARARPLDRACRHPCGHGRDRGAARARCHGRAAAIRAVRDQWRGRTPGRASGLADAAGPRSRANVPVTQPGRWFGTARRSLCGRHGGARCRAMHVGLSPHSGGRPTRRWRPDRSGTRPRRAPGCAAALSNDRDVTTRFDNSHIPAYNRYAISLSASAGGPMA